MKLIDKPKGLDEKSFITKAENGYLLTARYKYEKEGESYVLIYSLTRQRQRAYPYRLSIEEGREDFDHALDVCSERDVAIQFISIEKALKYLQEKENFKVEEWTFSNEGRKDFQNTQKEVT